MSEAYSTLYGKVVTFPGVKWTEREADHSPPSSATVKTVVKLYLYTTIRLHIVDRDNNNFERTLEGSYRELE
jgi:hypothetical protein